MYGNWTVNIIFLKICILSLINATGNFLKTKETQAGKKRMCTRKFLIFLYNSLVTIIILKILNCSCSVRYFLLFGQAKNSSHQIKVFTLDKSLRTRQKPSHQIKVSTLDKFPPWIKVSALDKSLHTRQKSLHQIKVFTINKSLHTAQKSPY